MWGKNTKCFGSYRDSLHKNIMIKSTHDYTWKVHQITFFEQTLLEQLT